MKSTPTPLPGTAANTSDFWPVTICFEDRSITQLFAELLEVRGIRTQVVESPGDLPTDSKIITEPQFLSLLTPEQKQHCLIVGNPDAARDTEILLLARPLTEEKIESAIARLLKLA